MGSPAPREELNPDQITEESGPELMLLQHDGVVAEPKATNPHHFPGFVLIKCSTSLLFSLHEYSRLFLHAQSRVEGLGTSGMNVVHLR